MELKIIAHIYNDYAEKFGIPRQSGLVNNVISQIIFTPEYRNPDAIRGIEQFSHLWLIWHFSESLRDEWQPTVRPPRLGGNTRMGVFATRSPFRPNPLGLSVVKLEKIERGTTKGDVLYVTGADLLNGTPIFDIKPYLQYTDSIPEANNGFALAQKKGSLNVEFSPELLERIPKEKQSGVIEVLSQDPRPQYQSDSRMYTMSFAEYQISFTVDGNTLTVVGVK
ncbi:MAG: tRNA (N6-threonylcarbamoyladenosine(37)-N6)-methyltransferase TrmO [Oscillospiraceae bacterium]